MWAATQLEPQNATVVQASYDSATLTQTVTLSLTTGAGGVDLAFGHSVLDPALLASTYVGQRLRAHRVKSMVDDALRSPNPPSMDLVVAVNTAQRISAAPHSAPAELLAFPARLAAGAASLVADPSLSANITSVIAAWLAQ